jgi:hypothetical protein
VAVIAEECPLAHRIVRHTPLPGVRRRELVPARNV